MTRDWELIRTLMTTLRDLPAAQTLPSSSLAGHTRESVTEHIRLLTEAGLTEMVENRGTLYATRLTWSGHELLEILDNDLLWQRLQDNLFSRGFNLSLQTIQIAADAMIHSRMGVPD